MVVAAVAKVTVVGMAALPMAAAVDAMAAATKEVEVT
jgi:hypothetical protein